MATFRLTTGSGINDIQKSYQYINYEGHQEGEIANYVVVNSADLMSKLLSLSINSIIGYGYYGPPGKTAITPFSKLCFAALAIRKSCIEEELNIDLQLPPEIASTMLEITKKTESI